MSGSDSDSPLSSAPESEIDEQPRHVNVKPTKKVAAKAPATKSKKKVQTKITQTLKLKAPARSPSPPPKKRKKEPPHEYTLADQPELAFLVMFRSRFHDAFKGVPNFGPQDIERGVVDTKPSDQVEALLCRLLGLCLNRKKPVEKGQYKRALEDAISANQKYWPRSWEGRNPMPGEKSFIDLDPTQRLILMKALANWALMSSEHIREIISENYRGSRREDDINVELSVQPWGRDGEKRRYWLIEGREDTTFRLYRESNPALKKIEWFSIASTIEELQKFAVELEEDDGTKHALRLRERILSAIPRFEEGEVKRKKREYRQSRKNFFAQTQGVSLYEGRTRGKRIKYTFSDDEGSKQETTSADDSRSRRSGRSLRSTPGTSGAPAEPAPEAPRFTASGRQIRKPNLGAYGEIQTNGSAGATSMNAGYNLDDGHIEAQYSDPGEDDQGGEWSDPGSEADDELDLADVFFDADGNRKSKVVVLTPGKEKLKHFPPGKPLEEKVNEGGNVEDTPPPPTRSPTGTKGGENVVKGTEDVAMVDAPPTEEIQVGQPAP